MLLLIAQKDITIINLDCNIENYISIFLKKKKKKIIRKK